MTLSDVIRRTQEHQPRDGTTHNGLGLSTSITNQENDIQACLQPDLLEAFHSAHLTASLPSFCFLPSRISYFSHLQGLLAQWPLWFQATGLPRRKAQRLHLDFCPGK